MISHDGSDFGLLSYFANDFTILPGYKYKIKMKPVCQLGELQYSYGNTSTSFEFDAGEAVLKHELPSICKPINCDTIDLPLLISASNNNQRFYKHVKELSNSINKSDTLEIITLYSLSRR